MPLFKKIKGFHQGFLTLKETFGLHLNPVSVFKRTNKTSGIQSSPYLINRY
jgi:hypothetical protein